MMYSFVRIIAGRDAYAELAMRIQYREGLPTGNLVAMTYLGIPVQEVYELEPDDIFGQTSTGIVRLAGTPKIYGTKFDKVIVDDPIYDSAEGVLHIEANARATTSISIIALNVSISRRLRGRNLSQLKHRVQKKRASRFGSKYSV